MQRLHPSSPHPEQDPRLEPLRVQQAPGLGQIQTLGQQVSSQSLRARARVREREQLAWSRWAWFAQA